MGETFGSDQFRRASAEGAGFKPSRTVVLSDIHLTDAEPPTSPRLWKAYKRREHFVDHDFEQLLEALHTENEQPGDGADQPGYLAEHPAPIELILNGDIFDFDSVMSMPEDRVGVSWLERWRGLSPEEPKSVFKMTTIIKHHPIFFAALRRFVERGHRLVFVIGNHDVELSWPKVQALVRETVSGCVEADRPMQGESNPPAYDITFADWFYISNGDTLVEHGHMHDAFCTVIDPLHPLVWRNGKRRVRLPFGNLAERYMLNGMGPMNPHVDSSFIKSNVGEYARFFLKEVLPVQPLLLWTWFWGACATFIHAVVEGFMHAETEPTSLGRRVAEVAQRSNAEPGLVWAMREHRAQAAVFRPWFLAQELWIDRVFVMAACAFFGVQVYSVANLFAKVPSLWLVGLLLVALGVAVVYTFGVRSSLAAQLARSRESALLSARLSSVTRVVHGHTHEIAHTWKDGIEYLNPGTWSPAFHDTACTMPFGERCVVSLSESSPGTGRVAQLLTFKEQKLSVWRAPATAEPRPQGVPVRPYV